MQNALDFLINVPLSERKKLLPKRLFNGYLNFRNLDLSYLDFNNGMLEKIDFFRSYFYQIAFKQGTIIQDVKFSSAKIISTTFVDVEIRNSDFHSGKIIDSRFYNSTISKSLFNYSITERTSFYNVKMVNSKFIGAQFIGGFLMDRNTLKVSPDSNLPKFIYTEFMHVEFDIPDEINPEDAFELCYYQQGQRPSRLDEDREYKIGRISTFVESEKPWSKKPVRGQVAVEVAKWRLSSAKSNLLREKEIAEEHFIKEREAVKKSEKDVVEAKKELRDAKKRLKESETKLKPKTKKPNPKNRRNHAP